MSKIRLAAYIVISAILITIIFENQGNLRLDNSLGLVGNLMGYFFIALIDTTFWSVWLYIPTLFLYLNSRTKTTWTVGRTILRPLFLLQTFFVFSLIIVEFATINYSIINDFLEWNTERFILPLIVIWIIFTINYTRKLAQKIIQH